MSVTWNDDRPGAGMPRRLAMPAGVLAFAICTVLLPRIAAAQQWLVTPEIELGAQHIDNPRLEETEDADAITGGLVDAGLAFRRNTETSYFVLRPRAAVYRYTGEPEDQSEDSESYFLDLDTGGDGLRNSWRLRGNYRQEEVLRGETTSSEIDDFIEDDIQTGTGRTFTRRTRDLWRVGPTFTMAFTELTSLELDLNYLDVSYDNQEPGEATDYNNTQVEATVIRELSEYNQLEFGVFASRYDPSLVEGETDSTGARVGYRQSTSDISTFIVDLGAQETRNDSALDPDMELSKTSFLWNIGYERQLEVTRWRFDLGQDVTPSGSGRLVERDLYRAIMEHQLQPRWLVELSALVMFTEAVAEDEIPSTSDRDYLQGRATLAYQLTRNWTVQGLYSLTHQDFADIPGDAQEHEVRLSLIYRPPLPE